MEGVKLMAGGSRKEVGECLRPGKHRQIGRSFLGGGAVLGLAKRHFLEAAKLDLDATSDTQHNHNPRQHFSILGACDCLLLLIPPILTSLRHLHHERPQAAKGTAKLSR